MKKYIIYGIIILLIVSTDYIGIKYYKNTHEVKEVEEISPEEAIKVDIERMEEEGVFDNIEETKDLKEERIDLYYELIDDAMNYSEHNKFNYLLKKVLVGKDILSNTESYSLYIYLDENNHHTIRYNNGITDVFEPHQFYDGVCAFCGCKEKE